MTGLRAGRVASAVLVVIAMGSCAQRPSDQFASEVSLPQSSQSASQPASVVSRIRVVNVSGTALFGLQLLFPVDQVNVGDVAAGGVSGYVEVPNGVYHYSAFRLTRGGEQAVQPVIDWVGESPLPADDYTYLLDVDPESDAPIQLRAVMRADPSAAEAIDSRLIWVRVSNSGPGDLAGYTMGFPDGQTIYFGSIPAGATSQYAPLYGGRMYSQAALEYIEDGEKASQSRPASTDAAPGGQPYDAGVFTYVVSYDHDAAAGEHVDQLGVTVEREL